MKKHWLYFKYVTRHKWFVFLAGWHIGVPIWRLILHDWTKFLPSEWSPYVNHFYGDKPPNLDGETGYNHQFDAGKLAFNIAWNHHQKRNDHHWQYWVMNFDDGGTEVLPMPTVCRSEMLADWRGAGRAQGKPDTRAWYRVNRDNMLLHPETRHFIDTMLHWMGDDSDQKTLDGPYPTPGVLSTDRDRL